VDVVDVADDLGGDALRPRAHVRPRLLWMRSFHPLYNPMLAVRVLARLRARYPEASLVMAGYDAGMEADVRREVARRGLDDAVRFAGFLDGAGKRREGGAADVFISTNHVDNAPVAVVEAAAMGLPVVATDVGGLRDLLDAGTYGLLVPDDDDAAMAEAVTRLVEDAALAAALSTAGRQLAAASSWRQVGPRWTSLFDALATGGCP
jgi:glycosyltransferase involved in cell wall biosynthesis